MQKSKKIITIFTLFIAIFFLKIEVKADCIHDWEEWTTWIEPTCSDDGYETRSCKICYETERRYPPATGIHVWTEWKADGDLCADGKYTRRCKECFESETKARQGNGNHLYANWTTIKNPNCLNEGEKYRYCYNCYQYWYEKIPADKSLHDWSSWHTNYSKNKRIERTCYTCGTVEIKGKAKTSVTLSCKKKTLKVGKSFLLKVKKISSGDKVSKYTSSNKKIASVNKKGKVVAKKKGKAKITVKMKSGAKAVCNVTVK